MILQQKNHLVSHLNFQIWQWTRKMDMQIRDENWIVEILKLLSCWNVIWSFCLQVLYVDEISIMYEKSISKVWKKISIINEGKS